MSWQESMNTIGERIRHSFMKDDKLSDLTFIVSPEKVNVPGHKTLLSFCSPVFEAQFYGPLASRVSEEGRTVVEIPDMEPDTFINFMSFLYRDDLTDRKQASLQDYLDLLYPASKYLVPALSRLCVEELRGKIEPDNVFQVYEAAVLYGEAKLASWCLQYMNRMTKKIIETPEFLDLEPHLLSVFLESDGLTASEQEIHRAVLRWAEAKLHRDGKERSRESIRNALGDLIYLIRFPTMSARVFSQEKRDSGLRRQEVIEIYRQISCKDTATETRFGTKKRRLDCNLYLARYCQDESLRPRGFFVMRAQEPPYKSIQFQLRTDQRIFLNGVSLSSILNYGGPSDDSVKFQVGFTVQVGDQPSVSKLIQIDGDVVEAEIEKSRRRSRRPPTSCPKPIFSVALDEPSEVPADCSVTIYVKVLRARTQERNLEIRLGPIGGLEFSHRKQVEVTCLEDDRKVTFEFLSASHTNKVPDVLFSL